MWTVLVVALAVAVGTSDAWSKGTRHRRQSAASRVAARTAAWRAAPPVGQYRAALLVEHDTGRVLFQHEPHRQWPPASMVKMMTALVAFDAIREGKLTLGHPVRISANVARATGSRVYLRPGRDMPLGELLKAMLVASANDASIAVAEAVAGSVEAMVERMNVRARELGLFETVYRSVNGLPPRNGLPADVTTAYDLVVLARKLLEYPEVLKLSAQREVPFGRTKLRNTNHLVGRLPGLDGLKTGYYRVAGFNLTATASRDGMRLVSIVLGCPTLHCRFAVTEHLMEWGFANYSRMNLIRAGEPLSIEVQVANGTKAALRPIAAETSSYLLRRDEVRDLQVRFQVPSIVSAPIVKDQPLGEIIIHDGDGVLDVIPALAPADIGQQPASQPVRN